MRRLHLFYLSALLLLWAWIGYRWWQGKQLKVATETPEVAFEALERLHQISLSEIQIQEHLYPSKQASHYVGIATHFDSLFHQVEKGETRPQVFRDTVLPVFAEDHYTYNYVTDSILKAPLKYGRLSNYLSLRVLDNYCLSKVGGTGGWWLDRWSIFNSTLGPQLRVGEVFHTDFGINQSIENSSITFLFNGHQVESLDTLFDRPGPHALDLTLQMKSRFFTINRQQAHFIQVVNNSK